MGKAKDILLKPISAKIANPFIKRVHYSGKVVQNSQLHIGVYYHGNLEGVMQFGPSLDKRKLIGLVDGTTWNEFVELNRLAFTDVLPRNSESRALSIAFKLLRKYAPQLKWVISFADATQCGDGTIYRAAGFVLTGIKSNGQLYRLPFAEDLDSRPLLAVGLTDNDVAVLRLWLDEIRPYDGSQIVKHKHSAKFLPFFGQTDVDKVIQKNGQLVVHKLTIEDRPPAKMSLEGAPHAHKMSLEGGERPSQTLSQVKQIMRKVTRGATSADQLFKLMGGYPAEGYQLRYIYFLDPAYRQYLTVPEIPFSRIQEMGVGMYKGVKHAGD